MNLYGNIQLQQLQSLFLTFKTSIWHLALHSLIFSSQMTHLLTKKNLKKNIFKNSLWNYSENWCKTTWKCENWKWPLVSFTSIFSASSWPNVKSRVSFEILRTSRFQNWPSFLNLVKIWGSYCQKTNWKVFFGTPCNTILSLPIKFSILKCGCTFALINIGVIYFKPWNSMATNVIQFRIESIPFVLEKI